jgi:hypothetical protein
VYGKIKAESEEEGKYFKQKQKKTTGTKRVVNPKPNKIQVPLFKLLILHILCIIVNEQVINYRAFGPLMCYQEADLLS